MGGSKNLNKLLDTFLDSKISDANYIPKEMAIKLSTSESYGGPWRGGKPNAVNISLNNETNTKVTLLPGVENPKIDSQGEVIDKSGSTKRKK